MLEIRYFPDSWEQFEEKVLLFLFSGRERLSRYAQHVLIPKDVDTSQFYQRYVNLLPKWRQKLTTVIHPLELHLEKHQDFRTEQNHKYLQDWIQYLHQQLSSLGMELRLINYNQMGKLMRYRPPISRFPFPD